MNLKVYKLVNHFWEWFFWKNVFFSKSFIFSKDLCIISLQKKLFWKPQQAYSNAISERSMCCTHMWCISFWFLLIKQIFWWQLQHLIRYESVFIKTNAWKCPFCQNGTWMSLAHSSKSTAFRAYPSPFWAPRNFLNTSGHPKSLL